ncbi:MAG: ATP-binding protein [Desulfitobacteriaceae bacterium]|nr:ATP-binding protein [Desulfitobacteriaceae bacterium]MDD4753801.1 ATP-binding protein [Desulfitobacteriaceae bacterium]
MAIKLKNKILRGKPYDKLIRKMFLQTLTLLMVAILIVLFIRSTGRGSIGNGITRLISSVFNVGWEKASWIYISNVRENIEIIMMITIIVFFIIFFRLSLTWFSKYFDEIVAGVDQLAEESGNKIAMSPELNFMEQKLNQVKDKLAARSKEAQEAERRKNELVIYLAHDIKTPLTSVIGYLNLLDEIPNMPAEQKAKYVNITLEKAYRLESLIDEFFEITRYSLHSVPLKKENIDLYYMLIQITDEAYPQLSANGKKVAILAAEDFTIYGDSDKLARVFNNILKNAIAYSYDGSTINISAEVREKVSMIRFENEGAIPQAKLGSIFEKFYRLDDARSSATGGAGLGLAIAKDIVTSHGGTIEAQSDNSHIVFLITLPNAPAC